jgi:hypothetical protein
MDQGTMAGLAGAFGAAGQGVDEMAQMQFKQQIDAANRAQKEALQRQQQAFEASKTQYTVGHEDARAKATLDQQGAFHADTKANQEANTKLRASEVASGNANRASEMADREATREARVDELRARAAGAEAAVDSNTVPKAAVAATVKEYDAANKAVEMAQKEVDKASQNVYTAADRRVYATKQSALKQAQDRAEAARLRMERFSRVDDEAVSAPKPAKPSGVAPTTNPVKPAASGKSNPAIPKAWDDARLSVPVGGTYIGPDGKRYVRGS